MNNYNEVAEKMLLEMAQKEEMQNKKLMMYENVIGFSSTISFLILIFVTLFLVENKFDFTLYVNCDKIYRAILLINKKAH